ncbi:MAG: septal ring lytic transglycosylase RlpA family protein [Burkholderiales bacterium]
MLLVTAALSGCGTTPKREPRIERAAGPAAAAPAATAPRGGGYYLDDGPGGNPPADIDGIPDAVPKLEPLHRGASRPYVVLGRSYTPMTALQPYKARGIATWYGRRYHGKPTSSGEIYDMYGMTAAHTILPIPSYVRVTNPANGKSVVVRINDRGPFVDGRLIDLSYTAAHKLGILAGGSSVVEVESVLPGEAAPAIATAPAALQAPPAVAASAPAAAEPPPVATAAAPAVPVTREASGVYLQLGAFGSRENAENFLSRLRLQIDALAQTLHVFPRDGLYRVHAGPYASVGEAREAAAHIARLLGVKPLPVVR